MAKIETVKQARRKQLIEGTLRAIGRLGYANATVIHVAGEAGLSPGIVNFYFKSKEQLLIATLEQIAEEYAAFWRAAIDKGKVSPAAGLDAVIEADFHPSVCNYEKISIWYAFWAEARSNAAYQAVVSRLEEDYTRQTEALCARIIAEGAYANIDARTVAIGLNAMIDGLWFDCLMDPKTFDREEAKNICRLFLASVFPVHFSSLRADDAHGQEGEASQEAALLAFNSEIKGQDAHRARLAVALRRRVEPIGPLRREALAASVGIAPKTLEGWLEGRAEPTSWQMGKLMAACDAQIWMEIYGPLHVDMERRFEAQLFQQREWEGRERAALSVLGATKKEQE